MHSNHRVFGMTGMVLAAVLWLAGAGFGAATTAVAATAAKQRIVVIGSSMAAGWVTSLHEQYDFQNGFAFRLARLLAERGFEVINKSVPGDTTQGALARLETDVFPLNPQIALIALSLGNEGLSGENPQQAVSAFKEGMTRLIARLRERGIQPVIGSCYASNLYSAEHYRLLKEVNGWLNDLNLPGINFLGGLEDGNGHFPEDLLYDHSHPGNRGHEELFYAIPPGLFPALAAGKATPAPPAAGGSGVRINGGKRPLVRFIPEDIMHSFSLAFAVRTTAETPLAAISAGEVRRTLTTTGGRIAYGTGSSAAIVGPAIGDGQWHWIVLAHRHLPGETTLYVDGKAAGTTRESLIPRSFLLGLPGGSAAFRCLLIHRAALNGDEAAALGRGTLWRSSLEVYSPLQAPLRPGALVNLAQNTAQAVALPKESPADLQGIEEKIALAEKRRREEAVFPERTVLKLPADAQSRYAGTYEVKAGDRLRIEWSNGTFTVVDRGMRTEILPETAELFFVKHPLYKIEVHFADLRAGVYHEVKLVVNGQTQLTARRTAE